MSPGKPHNYPSVPTGGATTVVDRMNLSLQFRRYYKLVAQRWPLLILCTFTGTAYYSYKAFTTPDTYEAYSIIAHAARIRSPVAKPEYLEELSQYYPNNIRMLQSPPVTAPVFQKLREKTPLVANTITRFEAMQGPGSSFKLVVDATAPSAAKEFAKLWAEEFKSFKEKNRNSVLGKSRDEIVADILKLEQKNRQQDAALQSWLQTNKITSIPEMVTYAQQQFETDRRELQRLEQEREYLESTTKESLAKTGAAQGAIATQPKKDLGNSNQSISDTSDPLEKFTGDYQRLETELSLTLKRIDHLTNIVRDAHPTMRKLRAEEADLHNRIASTLEGIEEQRMAKIKSLKQREDALRPIVAREQQKAQDNAKLKEDYTKLSEDQSNTKQLLATYNSALAKYDLSGRDEEDYDIQEAGIGSDFPIGPHRPKMILTGLALGFCIGLALVYFLHRLDDRLELAQEIEEALEEPVLGQIPLVEKKEDFLVISTLDQHDFFAESIRGIRSAVLFGSKDQHKNQVLLISSAVPGDGKTTFTVNFAITLALAGNRVLLVDADLRRGNIHNFFKQERDPGAAEILTGDLHWVDVLRPSAVPGLDVITSGRITANPGELLMSPISQQLIQEVRDAYDYIIFDCPPLTGIDDTFSLLTNSDGLLFVVRAGQTSMRFAKTALAAVRHRGARILGLVLNGITSDNPYYYYYSYYHAYYSKEPTAPVPTSIQTPGVKMAAPKKPLASIESEAKARAEQKLMTPSEPIDSVSKTEFFKARRAAQKSAANLPLNPEEKSWKKNDPAEVPPGNPPESNRTS